MLLTQENLGLWLSLYRGIYADFTVLQEIHHNVEIFHTQEFWQQRPHMGESLQGSVKQMVS